LINKQQTNKCADPRGLDLDQLARAAQLVEAGDNKTASYSVKY